MHRRLKMNLAEHARRANTFTISAADPGHGSKKIYVLFENLLSTVIAKLQIHSKVLIGILQAFFSDWNECEYKQNQIKL